MNTKTLRVLQFSLIALMSMSYCTNANATVDQTPTDDVSFNITALNFAYGKWIIAADVEKDPNNLVTYWASLDGGTMKMVKPLIDTYGGLAFIPSYYWEITSGAHTVKIEARPTWTDSNLQNNSAQISFDERDNVYFKSFNVSMVDGKWKATGVIERNPNNLVNIWASLDGGAMKYIGNQIKADGSFYFTPSNYWEIKPNHDYVISVEARSTWADPYQKRSNFAEAVLFALRDDVSFKSFNVSLVDGKWKATGVIQRDPCNLVTIWASLDGGAMKKIGYQIKEDGSFYFTPSNYWTMTNGVHTIKIEARTTWTDPDLQNNFAQAVFTKA